MHASLGMLHLLLLHSVPEVTCPARAYLHNLHPSTKPEKLSVPRIYLLFSQKLQLWNISFSLSVLSAYRQMEKELDARADLNK